MACTLGCIYKGLYRESDTYSYCIQDAKLQRKISSSYDHIQVKITFFQLSIFYKSTRHGQPESPIGHSCVVTVDCGPILRFCFEE